jgi:hypothetical protein
MKGRTKLQAAFHELKANPPSILAKTRKKAGPAAAQRQRVAIAFSKARAAGAKLPKMSPEAPSSEDLRKGYRVLSFNPAHHPRRPRAMA